MTTRRGAVRQANTNVLDAAWRDRAGFCGVEVLDHAAGSIDPAQHAHLRSVAVQITLTHDLLAAFASAFAPFPHELVAAQTRELAAVRLQLERYGAGDSRPRVTPATTIGTGDPRDFGRLLARGRTSRAAALRVIAETLRNTAELVEPTPPGLTAPDIRNVYFQLAVSSMRQLRVVQAWSAR